MSICLSVLPVYLSARAPARAVYAAVISDNCTILRGKCKSSPVRLGRAAAGGNTVCLPVTVSLYLYLPVVCHLLLLSINVNQYACIYILDDNIISGKAT